jgi:putative nucleotidyltransferase with HDIG domain
MLKKIATHQLRMGMHLHKLDGAWLQHPFWKTRFVIDSSEDLRRLHECGVAECWIDTALGLDVAEVEADAAASAHAPVTAPAPLVPREPAPPTGGSDAGPRPLSAELREAAAICSRGREAVTAMFNEARMGRSVDTERCLPLVEDIAGSVLRNPGALVSLARLKSRDDYSYMHSVAVCALMVALARQLGWDEPRSREAGMAGLLHDIGKAVMPLELLNKPGKLSDAEYELIKSHPERGYELLREGQGASERVMDVALHHHERVDGTGYPHRLSGDAFTVLARMGAICDVYDAITSNRPYKSGWDPAQSVARMAGWKGHFDPTLFAAFVQSLGIYPTGSLVRLESGKLAVVVEQNAGTLTSPVVRSFFSTRSGLPITPALIDLARPGCNDRIVGREDNAGNRWPQLDELWADAEALRRART